jgi:hypothetical protein
MKNPSQTIGLPSALHRLLYDHQFLCSAGCCKEDAFQFTQDSIARWLDSERCDRTQELEVEIARIAIDSQRLSERATLDARGLESVWSADEFHVFWRNFLGVYAPAAQDHQRAGASTAIAPDTASR